MATTIASGAYSNPAIWDSGVVPNDNVPVVISHNVLMDVDQSAFTGLQNVTITGGVTPGKLYWADGTSGVLKIRTGYTLSGTLSTNRGRLVATSDGGFDTTTPLSNAYKALVKLEGTASIAATNLDIRMRPAQPVLEYVHTYGTKYSFNAATAVTPSTDIIDLGVAPPTAGTAVLLVVPDGSTCPGGLLHHGIYYVRSVSGNTCKLAGQNADANIIDITAVGSGTIHLLTGYASGSTTVNVLEDVTGDPVWSTATDFNRAVLADLGPFDYDQQRITLSSISASSITLSAAVDSPQFVGAILTLASRNVAILSSCTTAVNIVDYGSSVHTGGVLPAIISTAGAGATFYGNGSYAGTGNTYNGSITGCSNGSNGGTGNIYNGSITGCSNGSYVGAGNIYNGSITGCSNGSDGGTGNVYSSTFSSNAYDFRFPFGTYYLKSGHRASYTTSTRNTNKNIGRIMCEDYGGVIGAQKVIDAFGDILRAPCDGASDRPNGGPSGAEGDCIEVSSVQSLCSSGNPLRVLDAFKVWVPAGTTSVSFKVQTNYAGIAAGNLRLDCSYLTSAIEANRTTATASQAIAQRSSDADWSQQITATINTATEGWIECSLTLMEYQAGCEVYIWPIPTVT